MTSKESFPLYTAIWIKNHIHFICSRWNRMWQFGSTKSSQRVSISRTTIIDCNVIISTLLMRLYFKHIEYQSNAMSRCRCKMPNTIFLWWIQIRIVRWEYLAVGSLNFVFAATFFAIMTIVMQSKSIMSWANISTNDIFALMLTSTVIYSTLVNVLKKNVNYWKYFWYTFQSYQPVKNNAANPVFWMVLSDLNSMRRILPSEVIKLGTLEPQNTPCFFKVSSFILE